MLAYTKRERVRGFFSLSGDHDLQLGPLLARVRVHKVERARLLRDKGVLKGGRRVGGLGGEGEKREERS